MKLVTADEMREMDRRTIEEWGLPGLVLMENAGRAVARSCEELLEELTPGRVVIVAGRGNNGGDGFVAARWLHWAGYEVEVLLLAEGEELSGSAATNYQFAARMGVPIDEGADRALLDERLPGAALIVDGVLGTGIAGEVRGTARQAIEAMNAAEAPVVAVDIPSGVDADTGAVLGDAVRAHTTVTMALPKLGLYQYPGRERCGEIIVAPIGMGRELTDAEELPTNLTTAGDARRILPGRSPDMHKGDAGRLLIVAGSVGMTGAAAMTGLAATRAGAGLVYIACPKSLNDILEAKCTEVLTRPMPETPERSLALAAEEPIAKFAEGMDAMVLGPGLSQNGESAELARRLAARIELPTIIDADGLNAFAGRVEELADRPAPTVITPHPGEMSRLTGDTIGEIQGNRLAAARELAERIGAVVLLKGAGTVIAAPDGEAWVNPTGNEGLATGGTGDVLSGMIGAFLAGGSEALGAGVAAAYYHGRAAEMAAPQDPRGLVPTHLLDVLPSVFPAAE
ncbi:MAG: NAD(P)H-hydrate dehydratase [Armatimonadota bacterium]|nr:NAD(P)H-hydrate dehydratase [Armatimonadota bacterium]